MYTQKKSIILAYLTIALISLLACIALFSLDKETHSFSDLMRTQNLVALLIYFSPTFIFSVLFFKLYSMKKKRTISIALSVVTGIPLSFLLVICFLLAIRH